MKQVTETPKPQGQRRSTAEVLAATASLMYVATLSDRAVDDVLEEARRSLSTDSVSNGVDRNDVLAEALRGLSVVSTSGSGERGDPRCGTNTSLRGETAWGGGQPRGRLSGTPVGAGGAARGDVVTPAERDVALREATGMVALVLRISENLRKAARKADTAALRIEKEASGKTQRAAVAKWAANAASARSEAAAREAAAATAEHACSDVTMALARLTQWRERSQGALDTHREARALTARCSQLLEAARLEATKLAEDVTTAVSDLLPALLCRRATVICARRGSIDSRGNIDAP